MAALMKGSLDQNQGHLVYDLDDPYIHMAMAKNLALHGTWGVSGADFSSSSSSLLWPLLLSLAYILFGVNEVTPLVLNLFFSILGIWLIHTLLVNYNVEASHRAGVLIALVLLTPLPTLVLSGLEHNAHIVLTIAYAHLTTKVLIPARRPREGRSRDEVLLMALSPLVTMTRYEGMFLVFVTCALLMVRRRWPLSLLVALLGALPIGLYGLISISNGWYFLPNPILVKTAIPGRLSPQFGYHQLIDSPHILYLLIVASAILVLDYNRRPLLWVEPKLFQLIFIATALVHMQVAGIGWFYRYEAYLVALGIFAVAIGGREFLPTRIWRKPRRELLPKYAAVALVALILISPLCLRGYDALRLTRQATTNIYEKQYQMGLFLQRYYTGKVVAAYDIGAIGYLADIRLLDLGGLADKDVAKAILDGSLNSVRISELAKGKGVSIALVDPRFWAFWGGVPKGWVEVGSWTILNNVVAATDSVGFYAVDPSEVELLRANLREFSNILPGEVVQSGEYTQLALAAPSNP